MQSLKVCHGISLFKLEIIAVNNQRNYVPEYNSGTHIAAARLVIRQVFDLPCNN